MTCSIQGDARHRSLRCVRLTVVIAGGVLLGLGRGETGSRDRLVVDPRLIEGGLSEWCLALPLGEIRVYIRGIDNEDVGASAGYAGLAWATVIPPYVTHSLAVVAGTATTTRGLGCGFAQSTTDSLTSNEGSDMSFLGVARRWSVIRRVPVTAFPSGRVRWSYSSVPRCGAAAGDQEPPPSQCGGESA